QALGRSRVRPDLVVPAVVGLLAHPQSSIRSTAAEALGSLREQAEAAIEPLLALVPRERDPVVLHAAIRALGLIGRQSEQVVPFLVQILERARGVATWQKAVPSTRPMQNRPLVLPGMALAEEFDDGFGIIAACCEALGGFPHAVSELMPALIAATNIEHPNVRGKAASTLLSFYGREPSVIDVVLELIGNLGDRHEWSTHFEISELLAKLYEVGACFPQIVFRVLHRPEVRLEDISRFVRHPSFGEEDLKQLASQLDGSSRLLILQLMGEAGRRAAFLTPQIISTFNDPSPEVVMAAASALERLSPPAHTVVPALESLRERHKNARVQHLLRHVLRIFGVVHAPPSDGLDAAAVSVAYIPLPYGLAREDVLSLPHRGCSLWFAWHQILAPSGDDWKTDADRFGVACIDTEKCELKSWELPVAFPVQLTGAMGARRKFRLETEHEGQLVLTLESPFSDERGWGNDNFIYLFGMANGTWTRVMRRDNAAIHVPLETTERPLPEHASHSCGGGELIVWKDERGELQVELDRTPYFLDDWSMSEETESALAAREAARERRDLGGLKVSPISSQVWICDPAMYEDEPGPGNTAPRHKVYDAEDYVRAQDPRLSADFPVLPLHAIEAPGKLVLFVRGGGPERADQSDALLILKAEPRRRK
ncbi:MAG: HEAT repeat domain-containing protein, partial [Candidatus Xenobia bacterium]